MSRPQAGADRSLSAAETLHRIRKIESRRARVLLAEKQGEVRSLLSEIVRVRERRAAIIQRGGTFDLKDRILLDALVRIALEKGRRVEVLKLEAAVLLDAYRDARARSEAAEKLRDQRRDDREAALRRRAEEAAGDAAAWRAVQERERPEEVPCEP
jgi:hypothetical protein